MGASTSLSVCDDVMVVVDNSSPNCLEWKVTPSVPLEVACGSGFK